MTPKAVKEPEDSPEDSPENDGAKDGQNTGESTGEKRRTCPFCRKSFSLSEIGNHARWDSKCAPLFRAAAKHQYEVKHKRIDYTEIPDDVDPDELSDQELGRLVRRDKQRFEYFKIQQKLKDMPRAGDRNIEQMLLSEILSMNREEISRLRRSLANTDDDAKLKKIDHN